MSRSIRPRGRSARLLGTVLTAALALPLVAHAYETRHVKVDNGFYVVDGVNVRNGNFAITYYSFDSKDGERSSVDFTRTYNSKSTHDGYFGLGWGSPYETRLAVMPDHTIAIRKNATGHVAVYGSASAQERDEGIERIVEAATASDHLSPAKQAALRESLAGSADQRFEKVLRYDVHTSVPDETELEVDPTTTFVNQSCAEESVQWHDGMYFHQCDDVIDGYTADGRIAATVDMERMAHLNFDYRDGRLQQMQVGGTPVDFTWEGNHVTRLRSPGTSEVTFEYDGKGNLVHQASAGGLSYDYGYDRNNNMTSITYIDTTKQVMTYDDDSQCTSVTGRNGEKTTFEYQTDLADSSRLLTKAVHYAADGSIAWATVYEMQGP